MSRRNLNGYVSTNWGGGNPIEIENYLTIVALEDGLTASLSMLLNDYACEYCVDGDGNWKTLSSDIYTSSINRGQTLSFRGNLTPSPTRGIGTFTISKSCNLEGNCMSMLFGDEAVDNNSLEGNDYAFVELFRDCDTIKSGVISIKDINDIDFNLKNKSSDSKERKYINNKRTFETYEISKLLVNTAKYYRCEVFGLEELNIKSKDTTRGKYYNKLVNNVWNRDKLVKNIKKRCNIYSIRVMEAKPNYSSFVGNFLFRDLELPDMTLASIEIGRRCYEYKSQYIDKTKDKRKNIILPDVNDFHDRYIKSLEEFDIPGEIKDLTKIYYFLKNAKRRYRVSLDDLSHLEFSRCFSKKSKINKILITLHKNT